MCKEWWIAAYEQAMENTGYEYGDPRLDTLAEQGMQEHAENLVDAAMDARKYAND